MTLLCYLVSGAQTCNDMAWLRRVGGALCQLLAAGGAHTPRILSAIRALLACRFPLVRPSPGRALLQMLQLLWLCMLSHSCLPVASRLLNATCRSCCVSPVILFAELCLTRGSRGRFVHAHFPALNGEGINDTVLHLTGEGRTQVRAHVALQLYLQLLAQPGSMEAPLHVLGKHGWDGAEVSETDLSQLVVAIKRILR